MQQDCAIAITRHTNQGPKQVAMAVSWNENLDTILFLKNLSHSPGIQIAVVCNALSLSVTSKTSLNSFKSEDGSFYSSVTWMITNTLITIADHVSYLF